MSESNRLSVQQHAERILQVDMSMRDNVFQKAEYIGIAVDECLAPYICPLIFGFSNKVSGVGGFMSNA